MEQPVRLKTREIEDGNEAEILRDMKEEELKKYISDYLGSRDATQILSEKIADPAERMVSAFRMIGCGSRSESSLIGRLRSDLMLSWPQHGDRIIGAGMIAEDIFGFICEKLDMGSETVSHVSKADFIDRIQRMLVIDFSDELSHISEVVRRRKLIEKNLKP